MTDSLFDLFDATERKTIAESDTSRMDAARKAAQEGMDSASEHSDPEWTQAALDAIRAMPAGRRFLADTIVCALKERGIETHDARAAGPLMKAAQSHGLIVSCGVAPSPSSNGSYKTLWLKI